MKTNLPLLVEWTPGAVRVVDPATGGVATGATIAECVPERGREAIVAIGRRSAFVRALPVPAGSRNDVAQVVRLGLLASIPLEISEIVFGFRLSADRRTALAGAMRAESLVRLHAEAQAAGIGVRAVLPVAFGAWLAARSRSLGRCAVVEVQDDTLSVDVVEGGELVYSRVVPASTPLDEWDDEVARGFATAGVAPAATLALGAPDLPTEFHDPKTALLQLADLSSVERLLFDIELPIRREARLARAQRWRIRRAALVAGLALATSAYAYVVRVRDAKPLVPPKALVASLRKAKEERAFVETRADGATRANRVLDVAFGPAQTIADVVSALASGTPPDAWVTGLSVSRGTPMSVAGYALRGKDVARFFDAVAKNPRFKNMQVVSTNVAVVGKTPVVQFLVSGNAVGTASYDRPLRRTARKDAKAQP